MSFISKGIDCYAFTATSQFSVVLKSRGSSDEVFNSAGKMQGVKHFEISEGDIGWFEHSGRFSMIAKQGDNELLAKYAEIAPLTGNLNGSNMEDMLQTPSVVTNTYALSYGFSDTGKGKSDQAYMYLTDNYSDWMGDLIKAMPDLKNKSFQTFALPGSHDAGMFTGINSDAEARDLVHKLALKYSTPTVLAAAIAGTTAASAVAGAVAPITVPSALILAGVLLTLHETTSTSRRALINLAYTQKDDIRTQLGLGVRYFDFRPGYNAEFYKSDDKLRHQHLFIPGYEFDKFLADIVQFLSAHTHEIVVVNINFNGFFEDSMKPSPETVATYITKALSNSLVLSGGQDDLTQTTASLLSSNKRLIILQESSKYLNDSYSDGPYATDDPASVIAELKKTLELSCGLKGTVLQLQATYVNKLKESKSDLVAGMITLSDATSPLLYTKAKFDHATHDWVAQNCNTNSARAGLLVFLNDFADNALTYLAITATKQRAPGFSINPTTPQWSNLREMDAVGGGGASFNDIPATVQNIKPITKLVIRSGNIVDQFTVYYEGSAVSHGGNGGEETSICIDSGDYVTEVSGDYGTWFNVTQILTLSFKTKNGKSFGPYGNEAFEQSRTPFSFKANSGEAVVGFSGSIRTHSGGLQGLSAIGVGFATYQ